MLAGVHVPLCALVYLGGEEKKAREKKKKVIASRCDALGWLRRFARFHGIKDSALNPRDCMEARVQR